MVESSLGTFNVTCIYCVILIFLFLVCRFFKYIIYFFIKQALNDALEIKELKNQTGGWMQAIHFECIVFHIQELLKNVE